MKTSARNQLSGIVQSVRHSGFYSEIVLSLPGSLPLTAVMDRGSCDALALQEGAAAIALVKSSHVLIATDLAHVRLSARNQLPGLVSHIERGAVNSIVTVDIGSGMALTAAVTLQSSEQLDLHPGQRVTTVFPAECVILGVLV